MNPNNFSTIDPQSSTVRRSTTPSPSLQRGKACLSCRRRKMKCDGLRPVCTPCLRGERTEDCEYTDGSRRPRTLTLEEDIARLRARVRELENPDEVAPSVALHTPYAGSSSPASPSQAHVRYPSSASYYPDVHRPRNGEPPRTDFESDIHFHARRALSVVTPYAAELGFFLDADRLRVQGTQILPALQSALALWSVHIPPVPEPDSAHARERTDALAAHLLSQTQTQLAAALGTVDAEPDPAIHLHLLQTGVLLAYYMQRNGQKVGARYYASGTWALAAMLRLHHAHRPLTPDDVGAEEGRGGGARERWSPGGQAGGYGRWAQPLDELEAEERVRAFWAVYALNRWFGAVCEGARQSPAMDGSVGHAITVPWPGVGAAHQAHARTNTVQEFLNDPSHDFTLDGPAAMSAKASVLLGEATEIAAAYVADRTISQSQAFRARFGTVDALMRRCLGAAMAASAWSHERQGQGQGQGQGQVLVAVHLIALAHVRLHRPLVSTYAHSQRRCVEGALGVVRVLDRVGEMAAMSPIYVIVWTALCLGLHARPDAAGSPRRREEGETEAIRRLVGALSALSQRFPCRFFAAHIEAVLPVVESITN